MRKAAIKQEGDGEIVGGVGIDKKRERGSDKKREEREEKGEKRGERVIITRKGR